MHLHAVACCEVSVHELVQWEVLHSTSHLDAKLDQFTHRHLQDTTMVTKWLGRRSTKSRYNQTSHMIYRWVDVYLCYVWIVECNKYCAMTDYDQKTLCCHQYNHYVARYFHICMDPRISGDQTDAERMNVKQMMRLLGESGWQCMSSGFRCPCVARRSLATRSCPWRRRLAWGRFRAWIHAWSFLPSGTPR